jgi:hypothetical protein
VFLLQEDGSGLPYQHPGKAGRYFRLPHEYWLAGWCDKLDLTAKAVLLILLSRRPGEELPQERAPTWYGVSADSVGRGLSTLKDHELVRVTVNKKQAPLSPIGVTWERRYTLVEPFAIRSGKKPQETARKG